MSVFLAFLFPLLPQLYSPVTSFQQGCKNPLSLPFCGWEKHKSTNYCSRGLSLIWTCLSVLSDYMITTFGLIHFFYKPVIFCIGVHLISLYQYNLTRNLFKCNDPVMTAEFIPPIRFIVSPTLQELFFFNILHADLDLSVSSV